MIYFIQQGKRGPIKIGHVKWYIKGRLEGLQVGNPEVLRCLGTIEGTKDTERELHIQFNHLNIRGEWFTPSQELVDLIRDSVKPYTIPTHRRRLVGPLNWSGTCIGDTVAQ